MVISLSPPGVRCQVGDFVMLFDPVYPAEAGAKAGRPPRADLVLKTQADLPPFPLSSETVTGAGEYEIKGVTVKGIDLGKKTVYSANLEGIHLVFLGEILDGPVGAALEKLGTVDILFLSLGRKTPTAKEITNLIKQVGPKLVIPTDDKTAKLLAEELGQKVKAEEKIVVKKKDLSKEEATSKLIWLKS